MRLKGRKQTVPHPGGTAGMQVGSLNGVRCPDKRNLARRNRYTAGMVSDGALFWSHLHVLTPERSVALRESFGDFDAARRLCGPELLKALGCKQDTIEKTLLRAEEFDPKSIRAELERRKIHFLTIDDDDYPERLARLPDAPVFLYAIGDLDVLRQPCVALVGTREMTQYGLRVTQRFVEPLVRGGMTTVSGLALGIDGEVAKETLRCEGKTVAVFGHGFRMISPPSHAQLAKRILDGGGLLLTEFPLDYEPGLHTFPARNRIIAGLSMATVVLEAPERSGALYTAEFALEQGSEVYAVPGPIFEPTYAGCNALIARSAAKLAVSPEEILRDLRIASVGAVPASTYQPSSPDEAAVYSVLTPAPQALDTIVERSTLPAGSVSAALTMLELAGAAQNLGGGEWVRR